MSNLWRPLKLKPVNQLRPYINMGSESYSSNLTSSGIIITPLHFIQPINNCATVCNISTKQVLKSDHLRRPTVPNKQPIPINSTSISSYPAVTMSNVAV